MLRSVALRGLATARPRRRWLTGLLVLVAAQIGLTMPCAAQPDQSLGPQPATVEADELAPFRSRLEAAKEVFYSIDQPDSIPQLGLLVDDLEQRSAGRPFDRASRDLLAEVLFLRAEAWKNLAEEQRAAEDLETLLRFVPDFRPAPETTSPVLLEALERARRLSVGQLRVEADPADLELTIDGWPADPDTDLMLAEGTHSLLATRAGHLDHRFEVELAAGELQVVPIALERTSAVLFISTRPHGAEVLLHDRVVGTTSLPPPDPAAPETDLLYADPPDPLSGELVVAGLEPGRHELEIRKRGFRSRRLEIDLAELIDYTVAPVILEPTEGYLLITGLPAGASLTVDDRQLASAAEADSFELALVAGEHFVSASLPAIGAFRQPVQIEDRETLEIALELRPVVSLVAVLGGNESATIRVTDQLRSAFEGSGRWLTGQCEETATEALAQHRLDAETWHRLAVDGRTPSSLDSWDAIHRQLEGACNGSVHLLVVLSDDIYATWADLWMWPARSAAAIADRLRIALEPGDESLAGLAERLSQPLRLEHPWLGARFIDSAAASGPVVLELDSDGPAAQAGLAVGDEILALGGEPIDDCRRLQELLATGLAAVELEFDAVRGGEPIEVTIRPGTSPRILPAFDPQMVNAAVAAQLAVEATRPTPSVAKWIVDLNQATAWMRLGAWREAVLELQEVRIPAGSGFDQTLVDYLLGRALLGADPAAYEQRAREAFGRAEASAEGRLHHRDGVHLQPRAWARSEASDRP